MNNRLYPRLVAENIKRNGKTYIPYIITCVLTVAMFYIISSLSLNPGIENMGRGGSVMPVVLQLGSVVTGIFAVIFLFYTNSFLMKRRKKEFGLYNILGMGKRHIAKVVSLETVYVALISLVLGFIVGIALDKLLYMLILKIMDSKVTLGFYISPVAVISTLTLFGILFFVILLNSLRQIVLTNPIELLKGGNVGEKEPKTKWIMTFLGIMTLAAGYYMAITVENPAMAIGLFFVAVILVIIGTYMLFTAGSIFLLKALKKKKSYYYKPKHFISVSGMIYRMKQNAVGLANICILSTMVLVMLSCTSALVIGVEDAIRNNHPFDLTITCYHPFVEDAENIGNKENNIKAVNEIERIIRENSDKVEEKGNYYTMYLTAFFDGKAASAQESNLEGELFPTDLDIQVVLAEEHNKFSCDNITLEDDQVSLLVSGLTFDLPTIKIFGKEFNVKEVYQNPETHVLPNITVFVKDIKAMEELNTYISLDQGRIEETNLINRVFSLDVIDGIDEEQGDKVIDELYDVIVKALEYTEAGFYAQISDKASVRDDYMGLYGGLFFLGAFLGTLFIMATILIIYYKQISEGYEDQTRFEIMQKVGMSKSEVRSAIHSQVLCVFFLPLITAGIHTAFAFNLVLKCMNVLGFVNIPLYVTCTLVSFLVFAVMYVIIYMITAKTYYKIVSK